jgi:hypothetical protein
MNFKTFAPKPEYLSDLKDASGTVSKHASKAVGTAGDLDRANRCGARADYNAGQDSTSRAEELASWSSEHVLERRDLESLSARLSRQFMELRNHRSKSWASSG